MNSMGMSEENFAVGKVEKKAEPGGPEVWRKVCARLANSLDKAEYEKWITPLRFIAEVDGSILIVARTRFAFDRVHAEYKRLIQRTWKALDPKARAVRLSCWETAPSDVRKLVDYPWTDDVVVAPVERCVERRDDLAGNLMGPAVMRFETLITGESNEVAASLARNIAAGGQSLPASVIVINGLQGVGKTHLLKALEASLEQNDDYKVAYISAEEFYVAYVDGATSGDTRALKARVRNAKVLLFDDLQTIAGKKGTGGELAGTIRRVSEGGGIVVLTADRAPAEMDGLSGGVKTVLNGAACIEIEPPCDEMRVRIVRQRAEMLAEDSPNFVLDDDVCQALMDRVGGPGRDLCGALISLYLEAGLGKLRPTMRMLDRVLSRRHKPAPVTVDMIKRAVCKVFDVTRADLEGERKYQRFVRARQIGMYLARNLTDKSYPQIGICFGKRHHTTVLYACRKVCKDTPKSPELFAEIEQVKQAIAQIQREANK